MKHKFLSLLVAIAASVGMMNAEVINGSCGTNLTWSLNTEDSTLTISGTGAMSNYNITNNPVPWKQDTSLIKYLILEDGITYIGTYAFYNCINLVSVTFPNSVESMGNYVFQFCSSLTSVTIPQNVTSIGKQSFRGCSGLKWFACKAVTPPTLGSDVFYSVHRRTPMFVPSASIEDYKNAAWWSEFVNYPSICGSCGDNLMWYLSSDTTTLNIVGTGAMGDYAPDMPTLNTPWVSYCNQITTVSLPEGLTYLGSGALSNTKITNIVIPGTVTKIGYRACEGCSNLSSITIPDNSVTQIYAYAFQGSKITSIVIPNSITYIGEGALRCSLLDTVYCNAANPPTIDESVFGFNPSSTPLILVPCSADLSAYQNDAQWSRYDVSYSPAYKIEVSENVEIRQQPTECNGNTAILYANDSIELRADVGGGSYWVYGYQYFQSWEDGSTDKLRTAVITKDTSFTANYKTYSYLHFDVEGGGEIHIADTIAKSGWFDASSLTLTAVPIGNNVFEEWVIREQSGNMIEDRGRTSENPLTINHEYGGYYYTARFSGGSSFIEHVKIGDLYYNLNAEDSTAEVTYDQQDCSCNYENLQDVTIPSSVTYNDLTYNVTSIGDGAFARCETLSSVILPESVTHIGDYAFAMCFNLRSLTLNNSVTTPGENIFGWEYDRMNPTIYIPCSTMDSYTQSPDWEFCKRVLGENPDDGHLIVEWLFKYSPSEYTLTTKFDDPYDVGYIDVFNAIGVCDMCAWTMEWKASACDPNVQIQAYPRDGYKFVKWADGNTDNPRTIEITQDTTMEAIFEPLLVGKCGKDSALNWTLDTTNMALAISGSGELTENYTYIRQIKSVTIGNEITSIGEYAFETFNHLNSIILGTNVKVIEARAFVSSYHYDEYTDLLTYPTITCYSQRPPTVREYAFDEEMPYSTIIYVPADYVSTYKAHDFWGLYDVRPLGAKPVETDEVNVTPTATTAEFIWPSVNGAATYELVIKDKSGNVICTLTFNANGQLTQLAFNAPARDKAVNHTGFLFTVTGLEEGTTYDYTIVSKDSNGNVLDTQSGSFTTTGEQGIENVDALSKSIKVIRNGQLLIEKNGKTYNVVGAEVK